jgi:hypothetical protein
MSQPAEDVRVTPQLFQRIDPGIIVSEIKEEIASRAAILTSCFSSECGSDVLYSTLERATQRMLKWSLARRVHADVSGARLTICATARAYC